MPNIYGRESDIAAVFDQWGLRRSEQTVMLLSLGGMSNKEIAAFLHITQGRVRCTRREAYRKANVTAYPYAMVIEFARRLMTEIRTRRRARMATA